MTWRWRHAGSALGLLLVLGCFALPLFVDLGEWDLRNDEAIYSYAVERMLDTGDWLTPRSIPTDWPFLEKPPLKFWIVAAAMKAGMPADEFGLRFFDALFGGLAFLYVYAIGYRMAGLICGLVSALVLFTLDPLLFEHGLRSNNMEAAVLLGYCGGMYHFIRWFDGSTRPPRHAWAVTGFFFLAFMTKLVAAVFLPAVCVAALLVSGRARERLTTGWRDWVWPAIAFVVAAAPWFIYQSMHTGTEFWAVLVGFHVLERFTHGLDPSHLQPWHFYATYTWKEMAHAGSQVIIALGLVRLAIAAVRNENPWARLVLFWGVLPLAAISFGSSKLLHYAYPFWPPFALAAGFAAASIMRLGDGASGRALTEQTMRLVPARLRTWTGGSGNPKRVLAIVTGIAMLVVVWTVLFGAFSIEIAGVRLFRNSSVARPLVIAGLLLVAQGYVSTFVRLVGIVALVLLLPGGTYIEKLQKLSLVDHPLRATRDCALAVKASGAATGDGVFVSSGQFLTHSYYFYFWRYGSWYEAASFSRADVLDRLQTPGKQTPVLLSPADYERLYESHASPNAIAVSPAPGAHAAAPPDWSATGGVGLERNIAMMLPGPFGACVEPALAANAFPLRRPAAIPAADDR